MNMNNSVFPDLKLVNVVEDTDIKSKLSLFFEDKRSIPKESYIKSFNDALISKKGVPYWVALMDIKGNIVAGAGIIENDFHERKDLTPNICALYVEENYRHNRIAKFLLETLENRLKDYGYKYFYLLTDLVGFYEQYGYEYLFDVRNDGDDSYSRYYRKKFG